MSLREAWEAADALVVEGDTFRVRCRSTFSGTRWGDFVRDLEQAVRGGLLDGAAQVEVALPTLGELWTGGAVCAAVAARPSSRLRRLGLGALLGAPDLERVRAAWDECARAFPALEHGPEACFRFATTPRLRVVQVGPHFAKFRPGAAFPLAADGQGPWLQLRPPAQGLTAFDALALMVAVNAANVAELSVSPLEPGDEVRVNGRPVPVQTLVMHRDGERVKKGTIQWFPVAGDVVEVAGLVVRYEEGEAPGPAAFANRQAVVAFMNGGSSSTTVTLGSPEPPPTDEDDD